MTNTDNSPEPPKKFQPTHQFKRPSMPTDESLRRMGWRLWRRLRGTKQSDPFIAEQSLSLADEHQLDRLAAPPACGPVLEEMTATFTDWLATSEPARWVQVVVLPPCDQSDVLRCWASANGHRIVEPPSRGELLDGHVKQLELSEINGDKTPGLIVIPRLERWFLRHHCGLDKLQRLLDQLATLERHCIVGCNSWAWSYLTKAVQTPLVLPTPLTFQAFDRERLMTWLSELSLSDARDHVFRFTSNGEMVFGEDAKKKISDDYFATLAAHSLGIPWVAWHQWRGGLKIGPEADSRIKQKFPKEKTVWVAEMAELPVPGDNMDAGLLMLQSLLIHDRLTPPELNQTIPGIQRSNVLSALLEAKVVYRDGDSLRCAPAAYPAIRNNLSAAGFPTDKL